MGPGQAQAGGAAGRMDEQAGVRVRRAEPADEAELAALDAAAWTPESGFPSMLARQAGQGFFGPGNPPEVHLVAELGGHLAGYLRLKPVTTLPENAHVLGISGLATAPDARGRGVASALLAAAERQARARGARKLSLRVLGSNATAQRLYRRHGFEEEGRLRDEFCIGGRYVDDLLMTKHLG